MEAATKRHTRIDQAKRRDAGLDNDLSHLVQFFRGLLLAASFGALVWGVIVGLLT